MSTIVLHAVVGLQFIFLNETIFCVEKKGASKLILLYLRCRKVTLTNELNCFDHHILFTVKIPKVEDESLRRSARIASAGGSSDRDQATNRKEAPTNVSPKRLFT